MSTKLFVGGLPWAMDNERLKQVFAEFDGLVAAQVILDRETGRSRGFGFVTYGSDEAAEKALALNGREVDGRRIRVDRATERPARGNAGGGRPQPGVDRNRGRPAGAAPPGVDRGDRGARGGAPDQAGAPDRGASDRNRGRGAREGGRDFKDDWGGGGPGRDDRGRRGAPGKPRGRRRGGRGARGGGEGGSSFDDFDDYDD